jgi:hypothetical protein
MKLAEEVKGLLEIMVGTTRHVSKNPTALVKNGWKKGEVGGYTHPGHPGHKMDDFDTHLLHTDPEKNKIKMPDWDASKYLRKMNKKKGIKLEY